MLAPSYPSQQVVLVRQQPLHQDRAVARPFSCHEREEPLSPILFGALVQLPADRVLLPPIWQRTWRNYLLTVACSRLRKKVGQLRSYANVEDLIIANFCIRRHRAVRYNQAKVKLLLTIASQNKLLSTIASQKCDAIAQCLPVL